jgi:hypothetical protein
VESARVHLTPKPGVDGSNYINATWFQGTKLCVRNVYVYLISPNISVCPCYLKLFLITFTVVYFKNMPKPFAPIEVIKSVD